MGEHRAGSGWLPPPPPLLLAPPAGRRPGGRQRPALLVATAVVLCGGLAVVAWPRGGGSGTQASDAGDGWTYDISGNIKLTTDGEIVCGASLDRVLYCVDAATGEERFSEQLNGTPTGPALVDGTVVVAMQPDVRGRDGLFGYSTEGEQLWAAGLSAASTYQVELATAAGVVAVPVDNPGIGTPLVGIDPATGEERWRLYDGRDGPQLVAGQSVYSDGERFYVGTQTFPDPSQCFGDESGDLSDEQAEACATGRPLDHVVAVDAATGSEQWRYPVPARDGLESLLDLGGLAVAADGSAVAVVLGIGPDRLVVLDRASGELRWEVPLASNYGSVAHLDGVIVAADYDQGIHGYDATGAELWSVPSPPSSVDSAEPAILGDLVAEEGHLYSAGFDLYEIDPADGATHLLGGAADVADLAVVGGRLVVAHYQELTSVPLGSEVPQPELDAEPPELPRGFDAPNAARRVVSAPRGRGAPSR